MRVVPSAVVPSAITEAVSVEFGRFIVRIFIRKVSETSDLQNIVILETTYDEFLAGKTSQNLRKTRVAERFLLETALVEMTFCVGPAGIEN